MIVSHANITCILRDQLQVTKTKHPLKGFMFKQNS